MIVKNGSLLGGGKGSLRNTRPTHPVPESCTAFSRQWTRVCGSKHQSSPVAWSGSACPVHGLTEMRSSVRAPDRAHHRYFVREGHPTQMQIVHLSNSTCKTQRVSRCNASV